MGAKVCCFSIIQIDCELTSCYKHFMERNDLIKALESIKASWKQQQVLETQGIHMEEFLEPIEGVLFEMIVKYCQPVGAGSDPEYEALSNWIFRDDGITADQFLNQLTNIKSKHAN